MSTDTTKMTIRHTFNAPVEKVWDAWTKGDSIKRWWGPMGFTCPVAEIDFREGGVSLVSMRSPDGFEIFNTWTYTKIVPMKRIDFINHFTDRSRKQIKASDIGLPPGIPFEVPHELMFKDLGDGRVELNIVESGYANAQVAEMSRQGMASVLEKLGKEVEGR